jgi:hypothetical protein
MEPEAEEVTGEPVARGEQRLPAVAEVRVLEPERPGANPARQAAAVAATGFVAGAATIAVVRRRRARPAPRRRRKASRRSPGQALGEVVTTRSFLVDVHLLNRE